MNEVYIKVEDLGILSKHFKNKDIITLVELVSEMQELDSEVERLEEKIEEMEKHCEDNHKSKW